MILFVPFALLGTMTYKMISVSVAERNMGRCDMAKNYEWSENFDAVAWHIERISKPDYDPYYDEEDN